MKMITLRTVPLFRILIIKRMGMLECKIAGMMLAIRLVAICIIEIVLFIEALL